MVSYKYFTRAILVLGIFALLGISTTQLAFAAGVSTRDAVSVSVTPEFPRFGDTVTITLSSYGADLTRASMLWKEGTTTQLSGVGKIKYTTTTPATSGTKIVTVDITLLSGQLITKTISINPTEVDLLVESIDGYTPPFYRGRSLPAKESLVKVSAIPQISGITDSKNAVYIWKQNFKARPDFSGFGKRYFVYKNAYLNPNDTVSVTASTSTGTSAAEASKTINLHDPKVLLYEDHPTQGLLTQNALAGTFTLKDSESTFMAFPYFSTTRQYNNPLADNLTYVWKINGTATEPTEKNRITLRKPERVSGTAKLEVEVKNSDSNFQKVAQTSTSIDF